MKLLKLVVSFICLLPLAKCQEQQGNCSAAANRPNIHDAIHFLKSKGVLAWDKKVQEIYFERLGDPSIDEDAEVQTVFMKAQGRALRLAAAQSDVHNDQIPPEVHQFSHEEFPGYPSVSMIDNPRSRVQRHQQSGLCHMHAGTVMQYYVNCHWARRANSNADCSHGMLDMTKDILTRFDARRLYKHVFDDEGGNSVKYMLSILHPGSQLMIAPEFDQLASYLHEYGPALVSNFNVHEDFMNGNGRRHYRGVPSGPVIGSHAMVLIGTRQCNDTGSMMFLLQNWWLDKQFVEVDEIYLKRSEASIHFVTTPQESVPETFGTLTGHWFETDQLDKPDELFLDA